jgi:phosphonate transport system substrate-binding protein
MRKTLIPTAAVLAALAFGQANAAWQDTHKALRVGFLAIDGAAYDLRKLEPFRAYLQAAIGMPVELVPAGNYSALIDAEATDRVQYAIHSATSYATAEARCNCIEPLAVPTAFDGAKGFHAIILARADSDIHAVADARGKTLAVTADDSIAGRLIPLKYLAGDGIDASKDLASVLAAPDPAQAIAALQAGSVDLSVGWSSLTGDAATGYDFGVLTNLVQAGTLSMDSVRIIWQSPLIPFGPHAVRIDVPDDLKMRLVNALTAMAMTAPAALDAVDRASIGGGGFAPIAAEDYAVITDLIGATPANTPPSASLPPAPQPALPQSPDAPTSVGGNTGGASPSVSAGPASP